MPDTDTTQENITTDATLEAGADTTAETKQAPEDPGGELGDAGKKAIDSEREARKAAEKQLRDAQKALKEFEDRDKTELQKAVERANEAEKRATAAEFTALRNKVAADKGVPASSLTGATEDEMNASADELIAWRDQNANKQPSTPKRNPASGGGLKSGATGNQNTNSDPKVAAAEALRRLRAGG